MENTSNRNVSIVRFGMLVKMTIEEFSGELGSDSPAPGGGSVAALSGALGANLISMVCRLSIGKEDCEPFENEIKEALRKSELLSRSLLERVDLDTNAFNSVMAAFKMPKGTPEEKKARSEGVQQGYKKAIQSPLGIARECIGVLRMAEILVGKSNSNALSDLGVASQQAYAGLEGAIMNVKINLPSIKDESYVDATAAETSLLLEEGGRAAKNVYRYVSSNLT